MATTMVHIRVDGKVKKQAAKTLGINGYLRLRCGTQCCWSAVAARNALPFEV